MSRPRAAGLLPVPVRDRDEPIPVRHRDAPTPPAARRGLSLPSLALACLAGLALFVIVVTVRGGPSVGDAYGVTDPTTALANGDLGAAAADQVLPQPPGYALLASPVVVVLRPLVGTSRWCDARVGTTTRAFLPWCRPDQLVSHRWYRSQGLVGVVAWLALAVGAVMLLRRARAPAPLELALVILLAAIPAASDGIVQTFHPQDLVCVGLCCAGLAQGLERRWIVTGVLFGAAFLCKQFAILPALAMVVAAPGWRARRRLVAGAAVAVVAGVAPFAVADPGGTWRALGAADAGGVAKLTTGTVLGMTGLPESIKLHIARDAPVVLALLVALWARRRAGPALLAPVPLVGLATACLATRLVTEVWFASYYLLAVSAGLLVLDLAARRLPVWSFGWIAGTGVLEEATGGIPTSHMGAGLALVAALAAVVIGVRAVPRRRPAAVAGAPVPSVIT